MHDFHHRIDTIISDNQSGSTAILDQIIESLLNYQNWKSLNVPVEVRHEMKRLFDKFSNFSVVFHFINSFFNELRKNDRVEPVIRFVKDYKSQWESNLEKACEQITREIDFNSKSVLLHSNSSAIHRLFKYLQKNHVNPQVFQTASPPVVEGKVQADVLYKMDFSVTFIQEAAVENFIREIDFAVFGADLVTEDFFINKAGTFPLALTLKYFQKPLYVFSDTRKYIKLRSLPEKVKNNLVFEKEKPKSELWNDSPDHIVVRNFYFDKTPNHLVTGFYSEQGGCNPDALASRFPGFILAPGLIG
ncbi:MAG: hypothetical protein JW731_12905 [Bacteroidales bacterium]|nr:hypothetical protein [Bacteroidales bacterium]